MNSHSSQSLSDEVPLYISSNLNDLDQIHQPACSAVIYQRTEPLSFQNWINTLSPENLPKGRVIISPAFIKKTLLDFCHQADMPNCKERDAFIDDVVRIAKTFTNVMGAKYLRFRVDVITTNACKKFHADYLTARLICTYRGTGTQFGFAGLNDKEPETIHTLENGSVLLMRGKHWPNIPESNFLHRSPPIEGSGETRLVVAFDPLDECTEEEKY